MRPVLKRRRAILTAITFMCAAIAPARALQGPPGTGLPGNSDQRASDPCEQAVKPHGRALGIQAQCEPAGGGGVAKGDFNGDGIGDLAVGVPYEDSGSIEDSGAVNVIYGSAANGLVATGNQLLFQGRSGTDIPGTAEEGDKFGWSLASGNFNGDDYSDLAVGIPGEDFLSGTDPGQIFIFHGSSAGLTFERALDLRDIAGFTAFSGDQFGYSLVWADFNGDTVGDLAIGVPNRNITYRYLTIATGFIPVAVEEEDAGSVVVVYGSPAGITPFGAQVVRQSDPFLVAAVQVDFDLGFGGEISEGAGFGLTLTAGDYDGDSFADLAVGAPLKDVNDIPQAGEVHVIFGSVTGLRRDRFVLLDQGSRDGAPENGDRFGSALASGDFNHNGLDDLAVGVPNEDTTSGTNTGIVQVFFGATNGFTSFEQIFDQAAFPTAFDGREAGDLFGSALAAGDFNGDGWKDLAIGVPGEDIGAITNAGVVHVVYGGNGLFGCCVGPAPQVWHQSVSNVIGSAEAGDEFGLALSAWNFGRSTHADLAVGVPFEDVFDTAGNTVADAGAVNVIYGSATGLNATGNQQWTQNNLNGSPSEPGDRFGRTVY